MSHMVLLVEVDKRRSCKLGSIIGVENPYSANERCKPATLPEHKTRFPGISVGHCEKAPTSIRLWCLQWGLQKQ